LDRASNSVISEYFRIRTASGEVPSVDIEVRATNVARASWDECAVLGLDVGANVRRITRLYSNAGKPFAFEAAVIPSKLFDLQDDEVKLHVTLP
ncbi:UTRA domain-containing protein, partial [Shewanella algae]|uniref:UTRA domain-containing protein n=1 Tax=Shewanella algae TaxID=38313 RepID=UPI00313D7394